MNRHMRRATKNEMFGGNAPIFVSPESYRHMRELARKELTKRG